MKHAVFILFYCAPTAIAISVSVIGDRSVSFRWVGMLTPPLLLVLMAYLGFDFFGIRARHQEKKISELAMRGAGAGVLFIIGALVALWLGGLKVALYSSLVLSVVLAPLALLVPLHRQIKL